MGDSVMQLKGPEPKMCYMIVFFLPSVKNYFLQTGVVFNKEVYFKTMYMASSLKILILLFMNLLLAYNDI